MNRFKKALYCLLTITLLSLFSLAQGTPTFEGIIKVAPGLTVDASTLNVRIAEPVRSKLSTSVNLYQDIGITTSGSHYAPLSLSPTPGNSTSLNAYIPLLYTQSTQQCDGGGNTFVYNISGIVDGAGTIHTIPNQNWDSHGCIYTSNIDVETNDNSGYEVSIPAGHYPGGTILQLTVYDKFGNSTFTSLGSGALTYKDSHSNTVSYTASPTTITDPLTSTAVLSFTNAAAGITFNYTDGTGTQRSITSSSANKTFNPNNFSCSGISAVSSTFNPLTSVSYPDGASVSFTYETNASGYYTGRLKTATSFTGGIYTFNYSGGTHNDGLWCASGYVENATMTINNGVGTWTLAHTFNGHGFENTTVTKPDGSKLAYQFYNNQLTQLITYDTNGTTVLNTVDICYSTTISSCNNPAPTKNPSYMATYTYVPGVANPSEFIVYFDTYGNITQNSSYDFGPTLYQTQTNTYGTWNGTSCVAVGNHIVGKPCKVYVSDKSGAMAGQTAFTYNSAGDLTNIYYNNTSSTTLQESFSYNSNGTLSGHTDKNGISITINNPQCNGFLPGSSTSNIGTVSATWDCNLGAMLTSTDLNGLTKTTTYGDPLNRPTQISDNGGQNPIIYTYSPTRNTKSMTFNSGNSIENSAVTLNSLGQAISVQRQTAPNSNNYDTTALTYDANGRLYTVSAACTTTLGGGCTGWAKAFTYDGADRVKTGTINTSTQGVVNYTYSNNDVNICITPAPSGENNKCVQQEFNGVGQLTSVCQISSGLGGVGNCNQRTSATGYLTTNTYDGAGNVTQSSRNSQSGGTPVNVCRTYDFLGRILQSATPESGGTCSSGTPSGNIAYAYYDSTGPDCGSYPVSNGGGSATETKDAAGNVTCNTFEGSGGRLSVRYFPSGPNSSNSHAQYFLYDAPYTSFGNGTNVKGRLSTAGNCMTGSSCAGNSFTILAYGYDVYGRIIDLWQTTANNTGGQTFHTSASYWDNGVLSGLSGIPLVSNFTYGIDGEGRPNSATNGTQFVSSVSYDSSSNPLTVTYGNGDSDNYQWDANTGNMTQYQFKIGSSQTTDTGVWSWSANGTLSSLAITDNVNSTDTQTCNTSHDDLVRITSWNCGAHWSENYSYDFAGNVTKNGNISFNPGYTTSNNHFSSGSGCTYDTNGNILNDCTKGTTYAWDSTKSMTSMGGTFYTMINGDNNDWLQLNSSSYYFFKVFSPIGFLGQVYCANPGCPTLVIYQTRIPLPGGSKVQFRSGVNPILEHMDWTGSVRLMTDNTTRTQVSGDAYGPMGELYDLVNDSSGYRAVYEGGTVETSGGLFDYLSGPEYVPVWGRNIKPSSGSNGYVRNNSPF